MLLEVLNIGKLELFAGMPLVQLMSLKWGSPLESLGNLALIVDAVLRRHQAAGVNESVVELPLLLACSFEICAMVAAVSLLFLAPDDI